MEPKSLQMYIHQRCKEPALRLRGLMQEGLPLRCCF